MKQVFLFSGTKEGRRLARRLGAAGIETVVSVSPEYGTVTPEDAGPGDPTEFLFEQMNEEETEATLRRVAPKIVVDATHPFALDASERIRAAAERAGVPYLRLKRKSKDAPDRKVFLFAGLDEAITALCRTSGNILVTTGADTLSEFTSSESLKDRLYVRIPPTKECFDICDSLEIPRERIIAMQGPFTEEMNRATLRSYGIRHLVTKQNRNSGGFSEKIFAAQETETAVYVLGAPEEDGISYAEVLDRLGELLSVDLRDTVTITVSLVGTGPGDRACMTEEAGRAIREADVLFGEKQQLLPFRSGKKIYPYVHGDEILPRMEQLLQEARQGDPHVRVAVLLAGDTGFHSGATGLIFYLTNWRRRMLLSDTGRLQMLIRTYPGISSVQLLAARLQDHWDNAYVADLSREETTWQEVFRRVNSEKRSYLLPTGVEDVERLRKWVLENDTERERYSLYAGYQLSFREERIFADEGQRPGIGAEDAVCDPFPDILPEGQYTVMIRNNTPESEAGQDESQVLTGLSNEEFLREKDIPLIREEVRTIALSKLRLTEPAVVYDIGSNSGSLAVELGRILKNSRIYAIEKEKERVDLVRRNIRHLSATGVEVVEGEAPEVLEGIEAPTHVLVEGSEGRLFSILQTVFQRTSNARAVILADTLEAKTELAQLLSGSVITEYTILEPEYIELNVSHNRKMGRHHALKAETPVAILSFRFGRRPGA